MAGATPADPLGELAARDPLARDVLAALALGALARSRTWVGELLAVPAVRTPGSVAPSMEMLRQRFALLAQAGLANEDERRAGSWTLPLNIYPLVYRDLLERVPLQALQDALAHADGHAPVAFGRPGHWRFPTLTAAVARVRLDVLSGAAPESIAALLDRLPPGLHDVPSLLDTAIAEVVDEDLFGRLHPAFRCDLLTGSLERLGHALQTGVALSPGFVRTHAAQLVADDAQGHAHGLRWALAFDRLMADGAAQRGPGWVASLAGLLAPVLDGASKGDLVEAMRASRGYAAPPRPPTAPPTDVAARQALARAVGAAALATQGRWSDAEPEFDAALAALRKATGRRRGLLPLAVALPCVLGLLAQQTPVHLEKALKFCLAEGGRREPAPDHPLGIVALAIQVRLGVAQANPKAFVPYASQLAYGGSSRVVSPLDHPRWLMRAWLKEGSLAEDLPPAQSDAAAALQAAYERAGLDALAEQLRTAVRFLAGEPPPPWFFVPAALERWQVTLAALRTLGEPAPAPASSGEAGPASRIVWVLEAGDNGAVLGLVPHEQKRGARGWGQLKEVPLSRLQRGAQALAPADAGVVRALRQETYGRALRLDVAQAVGALLEHPHVAFADAPEQFVELVEAGPELEVQDEGDRLRVRMQPSLQVAGDAAVPRWSASEAQSKELEALRLVSIWRDGPQRAKLIRLTAAQKRVAQLLGPQGLDIPRAGAAQLRRPVFGRYHVRLRVSFGY